MSTANTKIKYFVPGFTSKTRFVDGIQRTIDWFDADPSRQQIDHETNQRWDKLTAAYEQACAQAKTLFSCG